MKTNEYQVLKDLETLKDTATMKAHLMKFSAKNKLKELDAEYSDFISQANSLGRSVKETNADFLKKSEEALERLKVGYKEIVRELNE